MLEANFISGYETVTVQGLTQWDKGQKLKITGLATLPATFQVHFANTTMVEALVMMGSATGGVGTVDIPNSLLEDGLDIRAWIYVTDAEGSETIKTILMPVTERTKPADFITDPNPTEQSMLESTLNTVNATLGEIDSLQTSVASNDTDITSLQTAVASNSTEIGKTKDAIKVISLMGCVGNASTDNTSALNAIITGAGGKRCTLIVDYGTYVISGTVTIPATMNLDFRGGIFNVPTGGNLTINSKITAPLQQIFVETGTITINKDKNTTGYPEWFGDNLAKAISHFQRVELQCKDYNVTSDIIITKDNFVLSGYGFSTYLTDDRRGSRIIENGGTITVGTTATNVINDFPRNITIENLEIKQTASGAHCLNVRGVVYSRFKNLTISADSTTTYGVFCNNSVNTIFDNVRVQITNNSGSFFGFYTTDNGTPLGVGGNPSLYFRNCTVADTGTPTNGTSYGWYLEGASSDIHLDQCETTTCDHGFALVGSSVTNGFNDIVLSDCVFDACRAKGIEIINIGVNGAISMSNVYCAKDGANNPTFSIAHLENCKASISMSGLQLIAVNSSNIGLQILGQASVIVNGGIFNGMTTAVSNSSTNNVTYKILHNGSLETAQ